MHYIFKLQHGFLTVNSCFPEMIDAPSLNYPKFYVCVGNARRFSMRLKLVLGIGVSAANRDDRPRPSQNAETVVYYSHVSRLLDHMVSYSLDCRW
jgi:hypothetical protein